VRVVVGADLLALDVVAVALVDGLVDVLLPVAGAAARVDAGGASDEGVAGGRVEEGQGGGENGEEGELWLVGVSAGWAKGLRWSG